MTNEQQTGVIMSTTTESAIWSIYVLAGALALICTGFSVYVLVDLGLSVGWGSLFATLLPAVLNATFLVVVARFMFVRRWRAYVYGPQAWVLVLLIALIVAFMNYAYFVSLVNI
jgi:hypothetical protein